LRPALPFAAATVDAVVVAQAFHWFNAERALAELARVVRVGGRLGLIWNARDRTQDWVDAVWSVMDRVESKAPWRDRGRGGKTLPERVAVTPPWSEWAEATFRHVHYCSHEDLVDRVRSVSHIAVLPPGSQRMVLEEVRSILREHPQTRGQQTVGVPYRVDAMCTERLA
jgi:SAM-dependent methyltransferase